MPAAHENVTLEQSLIPANQVGRPSMVHVTSSSVSSLCAALPVSLYAAAGHSRSGDSRTVAREEPAELQPGGVCGRHASDVHHAGAAGACVRTPCGGSPPSELELSCTPQCAG